ncbi:MAG: thermonuclease family protein [Chromatiales bacterium]|nr:thermonuclease family protein [Chromatiales bacterium]
MVSRRTTRIAALAATLLPWLLAGTADAGQFLLPGERPRPELHGTVVRVLDGDTLDIELGDGRRQRIRLAGIDAPERGQPWSAVATAALRDLVEGKAVRVLWLDEQPPRGRAPGRVIGEVWLDELEAGREMVAQGLAWAYDAFLRDPDLCEIEQAAREAGLGLWRAPPEQWLPPWVHRARTAGRSEDWVAACARPDIRDR